MPRPFDVDLRWSSATQDADEVLRVQLDDLGYPGATVGRLCPRCGSPEHGRPWARSSSRSVGSVELPVSVSRSGEHLLTAVGPAGAVIGVDVEPVGHEAWVAREAVGKAHGTGVTGSVEPADFAGDLVTVRAPVGYVAALALLAARPGE